MNDQYFNAVSDAVSNLHYNWKVFRNVYAKSEGNIVLLNRFDNQFFGVVQNLYWDSILLNISRLTDNEGRGSNRNLTLKTIFNDIENELDAKTLNELSNKLVDISALSKNIRFHRSKRIAHTDMKSVFNDSKFISKGISRNDVNQILKTIREFMNIICGYFKDTDCLYDHIQGPLGGEILMLNLELCNNKNGNIR